MSYDDITVCHTVRGGSRKNWLGGPTDQKHSGGSGAAPQENFEITPLESQSGTIGEPM